jgi:hypothetical protein
VNLFKSHTGPVNSRPYISKFSNSRAILDITKPDCSLSTSQIEDLLTPKAIPNNIKPGFAQLSHACSLTFVKLPVPVKVEKLGVDFVFPL